MKRDVGSIWIQKLRSGEYEQGLGGLRSTFVEDQNLRNEYCCLGVLCEVAVEAGVIPTPSPQIDEENRYVFYGNKGTGSYTMLPDEVVKWAGMRTPNGRLSGSLGGADNLAVLNDNRASFLAIADIIEAEMDNL